jgi:hypothetical protein
MRPERCRARGEKEGTQIGAAGRKGEKRVFLMSSGVAAADNFWYKRPWKKGVIST